MADAGRPVATLAVAARPRLRSCRRSQRVTNLLVVAAHRAAAMGGLGIACPGNRPHSDAIFGRARGSKRLGALTGVGHPTYPAIGVTLDQREATPFWGTSGTGKRIRLAGVPGRRHGWIAGASSTRRCFACLRSIPKGIAEPMERGHGQPVASVIPKDLTHADSGIY
jgi:hypothetical protein